MGRGVVYVVRGVFYVGRGLVYVAHPRLAHPCLQYYKFIAIPIHLELDIFLFNISKNLLITYK